MLDSLSAGGKWLLFLIILFSNFIFLIYWGFSLTSDVRGYFRAKYPRFYLCFCLCNRASLLREEKNFEKAFLKNETVIEEIDNIILSKTV